MNDHTDVRGELVFEQACKMGLVLLSKKVAADPN